MKKVLTAACLAGLLCLGGSQVFAAHSAPDALKAPRIWVDGSELRFDVEPRIEEGNTLVQFRTICEKLGLKVDWEGATRTVTGVKEGLSVKLIIGNKTVWVNGQRKQLEVEPRIENGSTLVPLRFVGESTGREVSWDGRTREIYIAKTEDQLRHVVEKQLEFTRKKDLDGVLSTLDGSSPGYNQNKQMLGQLFAAYDLNYTLDTFTIVAAQGDNAQIRTTVTSTKVKGPEYQDNTAEVVHQLRKVDGEWKVVVQSLPQKINFLKPDAAKESPVTLSADEQKKVLDVIEQDRKFAETENFDAEKKLYEPSYPNLDRLFLVAKQLVEAYDLKVKYEDVKLIQGAGNTAKVKVTATITKVTGPEFRNMRVTSVNTLNKNSDGQWKFAIHDTITMEYLQ